MCQNTRIDTLACRALLDAVQVLQPIFHRPELGGYAYKQASRAVLPQAILTRDHFAPRNTASRGGGRDTKCHRV